jgi:hypothetical protein
MRESKILMAIRDACNRGPVRLWRNNVGTALVINHSNPGMKQAIINACIELAERRSAFAQRMSFGLAEGSGDLIGYRQVTVTEEMVGMTIAVFVSCEVKTDTGRVRPEQANWLAHISGAGGLAFVARSVEDAKLVLDNPICGVPQSSHTNRSPP